MWGNNSPVFWGWPIVNFVFWVGIGHAGTLISAILFLFRQQWRTSINRMAEAMTIFAVTCAGMFPAIHVGRIWLVYWLAPYPNWLAHVAQLPQPVAVGRVCGQHVCDGLGAVLVPGDDSRPGHAARSGHVDKYARSPTAFFRWAGPARPAHWHRYERAYLLLAALATPLVLSVHSVVSFDFAVSQVPGWHTTIFPPYFVAGAIFSGFAMVVTLAVPARAYFGLKNLITMRHLENMNKIILATSLMVGYAYGVELFMAWYSQNPDEKFLFLANRPFGPYAWAYWIMVCCNVFIPQLFWFRKCRTTPWIMVIIALLVNVGMWMERFVIIMSLTRATSCHRAGVHFVPTPIDVVMLIGSFGLFFTLFLLFCRYLPMVAMAEVKTVLPHGHQP